MPAGSRTRLPLQLGTTFVGEVIVAAILIAAMPLLPFLLIVLLGSDSKIGEGQIGPGAWVLALLGPGVVLLIGYASLKRAPKRRPSDILIDPRGLVVEGGSHHGLEVEWASTEPEHWRVVDEGRLKRLVLLGHDSELTLAETSSASERRSFDLTVRTLRELTRFARSSQSPERTPPRGPEVLSCRACGSAVAPDDADVVRCDHCAASVAIPAELRARVRHAAEVRRAKSEAARAIVTLLVQPSASATTRSIMLLALPVVLAWIFSAWGTYRLEAAHALRGDSVLGLMYFVAVSGVGCFLAGRALADRRGTFALVTHELSALAPPRPGAHHLCRACGAPLWEPPHEVVVICAYCETENVLGFDVHRERRAHDEQRFELRDALARRTRQRITSVVLVAAAGLAAVVALRIGTAALRTSLEAAGYVDDPSQMPLPTGPAYEATVTLEAPSPAAQVEKVHVPRVEMHSTLSEGRPLYNRVWECRARELAAGAEGAGTVRVTRWRKAGDTAQDEVRTAISVEGALGPSFSACVLERPWTTRDLGVALFSVSDRIVKRLRPPSLSVVKPLLADRIDTTLLSVEPSEPVAADETAPGGMWRSYRLRANAKFLVAGFENRCGLGTTYARQATQGCVVVSYEPGDTLVVTETLSFRLTAGGWCTTGRCYCGGDALCGSSKE
ncbi:MAG: hypothetical protein HYV09_32575 [Deltaproteobacteria bacterium]|nr:hypothetical protein [Deltaproteobacteria bacterium]